MSEVINFTETKKKDSSKIGAVIILIISALVFLPFGASAVFESIFNKRQVNTFGSYAGKKISYEPGSKFYNAAANLAQSYQSAGYQLNEQTYYNILNQAFKQTVLDMAVTGAVKDSGFTVPKEAVNRAILPAFTDVDGNFSQRIYNQVSQADIDNLKRNAEGQLTYSRYINDLFGTSDSSDSAKISLYGMKKSAAEKQFVAKMAEEKHSFEIAAFNTEDYPRTEAAEYGKKNADKFVKYDLSVITVDEESEAKAILKQINANEITFADALAVKSQNYYTTPEGKISGEYAYQIENAIDNVDDMPKVTELGTDTISDVIKTKRGYSIFKADGAKKTPDFTEDESIDVVLSYMKANEKGTIEDYFTNVASNFTSEAAITSFEKACEKFGVTKVDVPAFAVNYGNSSLYARGTDVENLASIAGNAATYKNLFSLKMDEISAPFLLSGKIVVAKCVGIQFDDVEDNANSLDTQIDQADRNSMQSTLMASDKVVDNFFTTYLEMVSNNR